MSADESLDLELRGRTWHVYWYMLSKGVNSGVSVREVQHALGLTSPSVAAHHLERLMDLGLAKKGEGGDYVLMGEVRLGVLRHFVRLGRLLVPRYVYYASFTTMLTVLYSIFIPQSKDPFASAFVIVIGVFSSCAFWYEGYRFWRLKPYLNMVQGVPDDRIKSRQKQTSDQAIRMQVNKQVVRITATGIVGALVAALAFVLLGGAFLRISQTVVTVVVIAAVVGLGALLAYSLKRCRQTGESVVDTGFESASTVIAIGLLFATAMASGEYLILVTVATVVLFIVYAIVLLRKKRERRSPASSGQ